MQHISGISRHQMRISSLEDAITADNQVRFIEVFIVEVFKSNPISNLKKVALCKALFQ
jgi:hypothetical protein